MKTERQTADLYKLNDNQHVRECAFVFDVGKIPSINVHLFDVVIIQLTVYNTVYNKDEDCFLGG